MSKSPERYLNLRFSTENSFGQVIDYLHQHSTDARFLAMFTLEARFLPFIKDRNAPDFEEVATVCANTCEAWASAIREYAGLNKAQKTTFISNIDSQINEVKKVDLSDKLEDGSQKKNDGEIAKDEEFPEKPAQGLSFINDMGIT